MPTDTHASVVENPHFAVYHRGFPLVVLQTPGRYGACSFAFEVRHRGLLLHVSPAEYGTAEEAEGEARRLVDDALGAFDRFARGRDWLKSSGAALGGL